MKIGILGTGVVGQKIGEKLSSLKHQVIIGTRNKENLLSKNQKDYLGRPPFNEWIKRNPEIQLEDFSTTVAKSDLLINATNGTGSMEALEIAGSKNLSSKILIDISNPLDFSKGMPPSLFISNTDSLGEKIQRTYPNVKVVKALNTMNAFIMVNPSLVPEDHSLFLCGNDSGAKQEVINLLKSFGWKDNSFIDLGDISGARGMEQILPIWVRLMTTLKTPYFNFKIVKG